jgi:hypothetical protein
MKKDAPRIPHDLQLLLTCLLRSNDLKTLGSWIPFVTKAQWAAGRVSCHLFDSVCSDDLGAVILELTSSLAARGMGEPSQVLALVLTNWEVMEVGLLEQICNHLHRSYPEARIEALWPSAAEGGTLDLILLAGDP